VWPLRGVKRFGIKGKLAPWLIGPFKVLSCKGEVAYELDLSEILSAVHNVFHVSQLKKCHPEMSNTLLNDTLPLEEVQLESDPTYWCLTGPVGNPKRRYDEYNSKSSLSYDTKV
jgi:hypothetical protein